MTCQKYPFLPQLWAQDVTPEQLGVRLAEQGERLALLSAEGGLFENFAGRYSKEKSVKIDLLLQAYDGAPHRVDRLSRRTSIEVAPAVRTAKKSKLRWIGLGPAAAAFAAIVPSLLVYQSAAPSHKNGERPPIHKTVRPNY